jgi:hypothetical protein
LRKVLIGCRSAAKQRHSSAQHPHSFYAVFGCWLVIPRIPFSSSFFLVSLLLLLLLCLPFPIFSFFESLRAYGLVRLSRFRSVDILEPPPVFVPCKIPYLIRDRQKRVLSLHQLSRLLSHHHNIFCFSTVLDLVSIHIYSFFSGLWPVIAARFHNGVSQRDGRPLSEAK